MDIKIKSDLLPTQAKQLASFFNTLCIAITEGAYPHAMVLELSADLLTPKALQVIGDQLTEEFNKKPPGNDELFLLSEYGEMLASLQKEYYVIHKRHDRIGRSVRHTASIGHAGGDHGVVLNRIKNAGGSL